VSDPTAVQFERMEWHDDAPGIRTQETTVDGSRWAMVEYGVGVGRSDWCLDGHRGFVVSGDIEYEFEHGPSPVRARTGQAFLLPGGIAHRGRNLADEPTLLFLIDDPART
jgi:hypothetical protein